MEEYTLREHTYSKAMAIAATCSVWASCNSGHRIRASLENAACGENLKKKHSSRRELVTAVTVCIPLLQISFNNPAHALIEADEDLELLEKVKEDRQKRLVRRGILNSLKNETASIQDAVYELSKAGEAIEKNDLVAATKILVDADWVRQTQTALAKVSMNPEQEEEAKVFTSSLTSLQSSVSKEDLASSKSSFVASANALKKWSTLTGLSEEIKGL